MGTSPGSGEKKAGGWRHLAIASLVAIVLLAIARGIAPRLVVSERTAGLVTFGGAALLSVLVVALGSKRSLPGRALIVVDVAAALIIGMYFVKPSITPLAVRGIGIDVALLAFSCASGAFLGSRIQHPGHLLPACVVAACADIVSVVSPRGPTHALAESERALSLLAISFPVPGTHVFAPALGVGDLVFLALILGAIAVHGLGYWRAATLAAIGILVAGLISMRLEAPIPALPFLAAPIIAFMPGTRRLARKDRTVGTIAIGVAVAIAAWIVVTRLMGD